MLRAPRILSLLLAGLIAVASVGLGHARGQAPAADLIVICSGHGVATIVVDASGEPVELQVICPDCALSHFVDPGTPPGAQIRMKLRGAPAPALRDGAVPPVSVVRATARAPPASA